MGVAPKLPGTAYKLTETIRASRTYNSNIVATTSKAHKIVLIVGLNEYGGNREPTLTAGDVLVPITFAGSWGGGEHTSFWRVYKNVPNGAQSVIPPTRPEELASLTSMTLYCYD